jgi:Kef-type K+ transport system membrane component KefB
MGYRTYSEPEPEESIIGDFLIGLFLGGVGVPSQFGWVFVSLGWVSGTTLLITSIIIGVLLGIRFAYGTFCRKRSKKNHER